MSDTPDPSTESTFSRRTLLGTVGAGLAAGLLPGERAALTGAGPGAFETSLSGQSRPDRYTTATESSFDPGALAEGEKYHLADTGELGVKTGSGRELLPVTMRAGAAGSFHATGTDGKFDSEDGVVVVGPEPELGNSPSYYGFNGEGRGLVVSSNPNNQGLPNGITMFTGDAGDTEGTGYNAGYSTSIHFMVDESLNGTAREVGTLTADTDGDLKFYKRDRPLDVADETAAQSVPIIASQGEADFPNGKLHSVSFPNTQKFEMRGGSEVDTPEGFTLKKFGGRAILKLHDDPADPNGFRAIRFDAGDELGWELHDEDGVLGFRDFGNGHLPVWDFNAIDGVDVGLPRYATADDVPAPDGRTHVGWDEADDRLVVGADGDRYEVEATKL
jgi:hypothetical protein